MNHHHVNVAYSSLSPFGGEGTRHRRGSTAVVAMAFLILFSSLTLAMFSLSSLNVQTADNLSDVDRARSTAESGLRWAAYRFVTMNRPKTTIGNITPSVADSLWPSVRSAIENDLATLLNPAERGVTITSTSITSSPIALDDTSARFVIRVEQHPLYVGDTVDQRYLRVTSTGTYGSSTRTVAMDFKIDKKVKFAVVGKTRIQLGRNTLVEGPVAMATASKMPPILSLSDFRHLSEDLEERIDDFDQFCRDHHGYYDNRVPAGALTESYGFPDRNGDNYVDEFDLFLEEFDADGDKAVSAQEFTKPNGTMYDANLFAAIDAMGGPMFDGDPLRAGYNDGKIDSTDAYAKIRGQVTLATSAEDWIDELADDGQEINDMIQGPVDADGNPIKFGASANDIFDLSPANFNTSGFYNKTGPQNGSTTKTATKLTNAVLSAADANGGTVNERTPYGSTSYQATYRRPVFRNMTFKNCRIPKGLNALFENCKFEGVTYVDLETNVTKNGSTTTDPNHGMEWSKQMKSGGFNKDTALTSGNSHGFNRGNNLRFADCTFNGPLASSVPSAYTHFANSWEFTGATLFDNQADETATIVAPQTNIEMGSFTNPTAAPSTLIGVVVAGNIDIRGTSVVDGSIIVTGDGAGNTTLGYFGASDSDTNPGAMPEGGYGRLNIRYNPHRALPDGINIAIDILPEIDTYRETEQ